MEDLRVRKTKKSIETALLELIEIKGFKKVRMVDIADRAMVNRNTIYLHYDSKEEIISKMIEESFNGIEGEKNFLDQISPRMSRKKIYNLFIKMFEIVKDNIDLYRLVLTEPTLVGYLDKRVNKLKDSVINLFKNTTSAKISVEFLGSGIYGQVKKWIIYDIGTIEENSTILTNLTVNTLRVVMFTR